MKTLRDKSVMIARRVRAGYMTAFILLFIAYLLTYFTTKKLLDQSNDVAYTNKVLNVLQHLNANIKDGEANFNAFLLVKDKTFLKSFEESRQRNDSIQQNLKHLFTRDKYLNHDLNNPEPEGQKLENIKKLVDKKYAIMNSVVAMMEQRHEVFTDTIKNKLYECKAVMEQIQQNINAIQQYQLALADDGENGYNKTYFVISIINFASLTVAALLAFYAVIVFNRQNKARELADKKSEEYRNELEHNVIELKKLNEELEKLKSAEKFAATGRMARTFAHEIRNPLTNISLASEQLGAETQGNPEMDLLLQMINRNTQRINQLITDLLNSTKFEQLEYRKVSINNLLDETLEFAKDRIDLTHIEIVKNYEAGICHVLVDDAKIKIAFLNIIVNAIEALNNKPGTITITTESKNNKCVVTIRDDGPGISEENLSRIFEPYYTSKPKGSGLGLTLTQNIILNHKGEISVTSKLQEGTTFTIKLEFEGTK